MRADRTTHRATYEKNRKKILKMESICGICGKPVNKNLKSPHPLSPCVDHIIPVAKGGHPSDIDNLQLAHWSCNRQKSDKMYKDKEKQYRVLGNRNLPQTRDWISYKSSK